MPAIDVDIRLVYTRSIQREVVCYMSKGITDKQKVVLDLIVQYVDRHGYPPAIREIGAMLGIKSLRGVTVHLDALEKKGYIVRESTSRSIHVLKSPTAVETAEFVYLPIVGTIAAGAPVLAAENIEGKVPVPKAMIGVVDGAFLLRVKGDSMIDAHITEGDLVIIRPQPVAENGDLVAARLGDEATIKRLHKDGKNIMLMPANINYQPIPFRGTDAMLIGKVIGLLRSY